VVGRVPGAGVCRAMVFGLDGTAAVCAAVCVRRVRVLSSLVPRISELAVRDCGGGGGLVLWEGVRAGSGDPGRNGHPCVGRDGVADAFGIARRFIDGGTFLTPESTRDKSGNTPHQLGALTDWAPQLPKSRINSISKLTK